MATYELAPLANAIRFLSIDAIFRATEGHQGVPLGMAEIATALFTRHLKFNAAVPTWPDRANCCNAKCCQLMRVYFQ